jgi:hypothetical protein
MARPEICTTYGHTLVANHGCPNCTHRVCRWCYVDEKQIRMQAREQGVKPNVNGPPDLGAVRFHERRAAALAGSQRMDAIETQLPEITPLPPRRKRKARATAPATNGVAVVG